MRRLVARLFTLGVFSALIVAFGLAPLSSGNAQTSERTIKITAHKFEYEPSEIRLKVGEPVVLELTSRDVIHGFNVPDLGCAPISNPARPSGCASFRKKPANLNFTATIFVASITKPWVPRSSSNRCNSGTALDRLNKQWTLRTPV